MNIAGFLKSQFLCHLFISYVFIGTGLIINCIQLFTLPLWPFNKQLYRKINCRLAYCISSQLVMLLDWWSATDCTLYTDMENYPKYGKENAIVVLNHNFEIDFLCGWNFCERFGVLGSSKVLAKKELSYVPVIGWMWYFLEIVFCKRKWEEDRKTVMQGLRNLKDYPEHFWFLIHCEGTRFTEKKHEISMQVAEAKGLPKLKYHLLPRTKGFAVTVQSLRNDAFQEGYYKTGVYPGTAIVHSRRPWTLVNWLFWASLLSYPLCKVLANMISSGSYFTLAMFALLMVVVSVGVRRMIGVTEIDRGSTYGNSENKQKKT